MSFTTDVSFLEETHAVKTLVILLREEPIRKTDFYGFIGTNTTPLKKRLEEFEEMGLVTIEPDPRHHSAFLLALTPKGRAIAEKLRDIDGILKGR